MWNLKTKKEQQLHPLRDAVASRIAGWFAAMQLKTVIVLQQWDRRFTFPQKKILLLVFCVISGTYCSYLLGHALFSKTGATAMRYAPIPPVAQPPPLPAPGRYRSIKKQ